MAKYWITHKCGHEVQISQTGPDNERTSRREWLANQDCWSCRSKVESDKMKAEGEYEIVRMKYSKYKNDFEGFKTVSDSYDSETKTIEVFVNPILLKARLVFSKTKNTVRLRQTVSEFLSDMLGRSEDDRLKFVEQVTAAEGPGWEILVSDCLEEAKLTETKIRNGKLN